MSADAEPREEPTRLPVDRDLRWFAEKIIAGEFKHLAVGMVDPDNNTHVFCEGGIVPAIGLAQWMRDWWIDRLKNFEDGVPPSQDATES